MGDLGSRSLGFAFVYQTVQTPIASHPLTVVVQPKERVVWGPEHVEQTYWARLQYCEDVGCSLPTIRQQQTVVLKALMGEREHKTVDPKIE